MDSVGPFGVFLISTRGDVDGDDETVLPIDGEVYILLVITYFVDAVDPDLEHPDDVTFLSVDQVIGE
jgi:hypothetical protein